MKKKIKNTILFSLLLFIIKTNAQNTIKFEKKINKIEIATSLNTILKEEEREVDSLINKEIKEGEILKEQIKKNIALLEFSSQNKYSMPINTIYVTSDFGERIHPITKEKKSHFGVDVRAKYSKVKSMFDGEVIENGYEKGYGYFIKIKNQDLEVLYAHLKNYKKKIGEKVKAGEVVAVSGNSGLSTAPHLHIEMFYKGERFNPLLFINNIEKLNKYFGNNNRKIERSIN